MSPAVAQTTPAANPTPPVAITGAGSQVTGTGATVGAAIDPGGADTTYRFEYGTTTAYGLSTASVLVPGTSPAVSVTSTVTGLTAGTTYHFRISATNAAGTVTGGDGTFNTVAAAKAPSVQTRSVTDLTASGATLVGRVNPNGTATQYSFEYGPTKSYGSTTAPADAGAGTSTIQVTTPLGGIAPNTKLYYRVVATSAAGTRKGAAHTFTTSRSVAGISLKASSSAVTWNSSTALGGIVSGAGVSRVKVRLLRQDYPFTSDYRQVAVQTSSTSGAYGFTVGPLYSRTRFQVVTDTPTPFFSSVATIESKLLTKLRVSSKQRTRVRLRGLIYPEIPGGTASIQRQTSTGRWITVTKVTPTKISTGNRSGFYVWVSRLSKTIRYRAIIRPVGTEHIRTTTPSVVAAKR